MPHRRHTEKAQTDRNTMRCVVDAEGRLAFVSPALGWALGRDAETLLRQPAGAIMKVAGAAADFSALAPGFHEIALLRQKRDPLVVQARIDGVQMADGRRTVIWLDPDDGLRRESDAEISRAAQDLAALAGEKTRQPAAAAGNGTISRDDGELRHFLNITSDLLGVYRQDLSFVRVNPAFNRVLGYADPELRQFPFSDLVHPEDRDSALQAMQKVMQALPEKETHAHFECRTRCRNGGFRHVAWIQKATGGFIYIVGHDVTDIRQHEAELRRREEQLSEAQKIGRMGHWYWEIGKEEMEWSDQIYDIFGLDKARFRPRTADISAMILKRDLGRIYKAFRRATLRKKDYGMEFRLRRPEGGIRYIRCEGRCKTNPKTGAAEALFGVMQDITERTLHERALHAAKEAAENAYASKTRFLANMSHELRTPLNAVIGFSEMIQRQLLGPIGNPRYLDYIGGIRESGEHLLNLINDILDMSKIEVGKYELYVEEINVGKLIRLAIHMVEGRAHESQVRLVTDDIAEDLQITADRRALMQILLNLLSNAVKFTPAGGAVEVQCQRDIAGAAIIVSDTGVGIPEDKIDIVTMPFEQVGGALTRSHEGSGLGLAITKDLIELHGGTLHIDSAVGVGTTVTVLLPEKIPETRNIRRAEAAA